VGSSIYADVSSLAYFKTDPLSKEALTTSAATTVISHLMARPLAIPTLHQANTINKILQVERLLFAAAHTTGLTSVRLTPKIRSVFGPLFAISELVGGFHFSTKKSMRF
jgi:hypothetical protein